MEKNKTDRKGVIIVVLLILLILSLGYIALQKLNQWRYLNFQRAAAYGYKQAIIEIAQKSQNCQQVPLIVGNQTINLIDSNCFYQQFNQLLPASNSSQIQNSSQ